MKLILVRHGHVEGITPPVFRGQRDLPLTALGQAQAAATAARIAAEWHVDAVYSSPLQRTVDTADAIAHQYGRRHQTLARLIDFDYGEWSGKSHEDVRARWGSLYDLWFRMPQLVQVPGGDTLQALASRAADALRQMLAAHQQQTVVAVAHDSVNRALLLQLLDMPLSGYWRIAQDPCCINEIDISERVSVRRINEHGHLLGLGKAG